MNEIHYLSKDHLDSTDVISNSAGAAELRSSFGGFGQRRNAAGWSGTPAAADLTEISATTRHGFTGYEMLDNLNLTHMNGRVYDQITGRFLSADPFVQDPFDSQSLNRYSYVSNNPLSFTDPSGFQADGPERTGSSFAFPSGIAAGTVYSIRGKLTHPNQRTRAPATGTPLTQGTSGAGFGVSKIGSAVGGIEFDALRRRDIQTGVNSLTQADFYDLLGRGYFERPASSLVLIGGGLAEIPTPNLKFRFYAGDDPVATAGQRVAGVLAFYDLALTIVTARIGGLAGGARLSAQRGISVIGSIPEYANVARQVGGRFFELPPLAVFKSLTPAEVRVSNIRFLDQVIRQGDDVILTTPIGRARLDSALEFEIKYLLQRGYTLAENGTRLLAPR